MRINFTIILFLAGFQLQTFQLKAMKPQRFVDIPFVWINEGYWMSIYEVTQDQYQSIMGVNPSIQTGNDHPVESVSWFDAVKFCEVITKKADKLGQLPKGYVFSLPTSAEWEFAAKSYTQETEYKFAGSDSLNNVGWFKGNSKNMHHSVGQKEPNKFGIFDLTGNVWEWCLDSLPENKTGKKGEETRIKRGGCYFNDERTCLVTNLGEMNPSAKGQRYGIRLVLAKRNLR
jgi:formylglycine-generating enzyme required for sulfatase activity